MTDPTWHADGFGNHYLNVPSGLFQIVVREGVCMDEEPQDFIIEFRGISNFKMGASTDLTHAKKKAEIYAQDLISRDYQFLNRDYVMEAIGIDKAEIEQYMRQIRKDWMERLKEPEEENP